MMVGGRLKEMKSLREREKEGAFTNLRLGYTGNAVL